MDMSQPPGSLKLTSSGPLTVMTTSLLRPTSSAPPSPALSPQHRDRERGPSTLGTELRASGSSESLKPSPPTTASGRFKQSRISSVTIAPRQPVGPTSPTRPLVPPPPSDFEIYKDEQVLVLFVFIDDKLLF